MRHACPHVKLYVHVIAPRGRAVSGSGLGAGGWAQAGAWALASCHTAETTLFMLVHGDTLYSLVHSSHQLFIACSSFADRLCMIPAVAHSSSLSCTPVSTSAAELLLCCALAHACDAIIEPLSRCAGRRRRRRERRHPA